jgi:SAM-dependent methyltransferase
MSMRRFFLTGGDPAGRVPSAGLSREQGLPGLVDLMCGSAGFDRWRSQTVEELAGRVVEIGFGSGLNVPHYPPHVDVVSAVEPAMVAGRIAERRTAASPARVEHVGLDGQQIPLDDALCDAALFTFTLYTVSGPEQALSELRRVVRPGGTVHFLEHGLSPDAGVATWQRRIEPTERRLADGCHLNRDPTRPGSSSEPGSSWNETSSATYAAPNPGAGSPSGSPPSPWRDLPGPAADPQRSNAVGCLGS